MVNPDTVPNDHIYFAPDDNVLAPLNDLINGAQKEIRIAAYGIVDPDLITSLVAAKRRGVDIQCVIDKVQASGKQDAIEIGELKAAGIPVRIGTSDRHHIMHLKVVVVDQHITFFGSFNLTSTAQLEDNIAEIVDDPVRASRFLAKWKQVWDFMGTEAQ